MFTASDSRLTCSSGGSCTPARHSSTYTACCCWKLAEIQSVAGADPRAALMASGVGVQEGMSTYDLGRALYRGERKARGENSDV